MMQAFPRPTDIRLLRRSRRLDLVFEDGASFELPCEYLRVYSPSAEVRGHGPGQEKLVRGKEEVNIRAIEPVGQYAVRLIFDDGHDSGLYDWKLLYDLGQNYELYWQQYLQSLTDAGFPRQAGDNSKEQPEP